MLRRQRERKRHKQRKRERNWEITNHFLYLTVQLSFASTNAMCHIDRSYSKRTKTMNRTKSRDDGVSSQLYYYYFILQMYAFFLHTVSNLLCSFCEKIEKEIINLLEPSRSKISQNFKMRDERITPFLYMFDVVNFRNNSLCFCGVVESALFWFVASVLQLDAISPKTSSLFYCFHFCVFLAVVGKLIFIQVNFSQPFLCVRMC